SSVSTRLSLWTRTTRPGRQALTSTARSSADSSPSWPAVAGSSAMMVRLRESSPLARTRSWPGVVSSGSSSCWKLRVHCRCRGGLERFLRSSTRIFFFFAMLLPPLRPCPIHLLRSLTFSLASVRGYLLDYICPHPTARAYKLSSIVEHNPAKVEV